MKKFANVILGVVTSIGGFVEAGSISTAMQAGADFGFELLWAIALAALLIAILVEMSGRLAALSGRPYAAAVRDRFGAHFQVVLLGAELITDFLLITAEIGGAAIAWQLVTGYSFPWWVVPIGALAATLLWFGSFAVIEDGLGLLGLITLAFVLGAWRLQPALPLLGSGFVPSLPDHDLARYAFLAVTIVGATVSPYLLNFYGSGAVEEEWSEQDLWSNRITAFLGMGFGAVVSMATLVIAAMVLRPRGIAVDSFAQAAFAMVPLFGAYGIKLFAAALFVGCFGAAAEIALNAGYLLSQGFGWRWGANKPRRSAARFSAAVLIMLIAGLLFALLGFDPLRLTLISVGLTVVLMPIVVLPLLVVMNDRRFVQQHANSAAGNAVLAALIVVGAVLAAVVVPLEILGG